MRANIPRGGMANMQNMIKKAQQMQEDMVAAQAELDKKEYKATSGGGMVEVTVTGKKEVIAINLNPEVVDPEDTEMLGDLIIAAINEAIKTAEQESSSVMDEITGGLQIPGM
ncbi:MAG: YbaB/EbfC family nucleoid-associated protein [Oscillospiraceae bacterium]